MKKAVALNIIDNLDSDQYDVVEKTEAIIEVAQMATHNSVKKTSMVSAINFLLDLLNNVLPEAETAEEPNHEA